MAYMKDATGRRLDSIVVVPGGRPAPTVAPSAPVDVAALAIGTGSATVAWKAPHGSRGQALTYTVTASTGQTATVTSSAIPNSATVTGLTNGTAVTFTVRATNAIGAGAVSTASNTVTPASDPLGLNIAGLVLCLDADQITGVANGASVATVPDASGNGLPATAAGGAQPTLLSSWQNAKPALTFTGTNEAMSSQFNTALTSGRMTTFVVFDVTTFNSDARVWSNNVNNTMKDSQTGFGFDTYNSYMRTISCAGAPVNSASTLALNTPYLASIVTPGFAYLNGASSSPNILNAAIATTAPFYLGSVAGVTKRHKGRIAHVRVYNRALTTTERHSVEAALAAKYNLTVSVA